MYTKELFKQFHYDMSIVIRHKSLYFQNNEWVVDLKKDNTQKK